MLLQLLLVGLHRRVRYKEQSGPINTTVCVINMLGTHSQYTRINVY